MPRPVTIRLSSQLRAWCGGAAALELEAPSVRSALAELERSHPQLYRSICDETGAVRRHVNLFVNGANVRDGGGIDTALSPGDEVMVLPAVSGG
jgi:MoaD family protein